MSSSNRLIVAILAVAALAVAFWMLALSPKREKVDELSKKVDSLNVSLAEAQSSAKQAEAARQAFPADYRQLVLLGQAVPASDETSSLLIELGGVAASSKLAFESIQLNGGGEAAAAAEPTAAAPEATAPTEPSSAVPAAATVPPTEAAASLLPLGATVGTAGLGVMPYRITFSGDFFEVADFIEKIDALVQPGSSTVSVSGRLITIDGFALNPDAEMGFPHLDATFAVTTYVTPPSQGVTAGATPTEPAPSVPAASPEGGEEAPEAAEPETETSETVSAR